MFQNFIDILKAPNNVFERLKSNPTFLYPLLLVLFASVSFQIGYVTLIDFAWFQDQLIGQMLSANPNLRESEVSNIVAMFSPRLMAISSTVLAIVMILGANALYAVYLNFFSATDDNDYSFIHWFALSVWCSIPSILVALAAWAVILSSSNGQIPQTALQPLSIDALLGLNSGKTLLQNINLPQFWSFALVILGFRCFTGKSLVTSALASLAPYVLIYGIWALVSL